MKSLNNYINEVLVKHNLTSSDNPKFERQILQYSDFADRARGGIVMLRNYISDYTREDEIVDHLSDYQKELLIDLIDDLDKNYKGATQDQQDHILNGDAPYYKRAVCIYNILKWGLEDPLITDIRYKKLKNILDAITGDTPKSILDKASWDE